MSHDHWHCPVCKGNYDHGEKCECESSNNESDEFFVGEADKELPWVIVPNK